MHKFFILIFVVLFISSCTSNTIYKKPKDLIPPDEMVNLIADIYIANAAANVPNKLGYHRAQYLPLVYKKYKIDSARFNRSNIYYLSRIKEYKLIQQKALKKLENLKDKYRLVLSKQDSINKLRRDSIKKRKHKNKFPKKIPKITPRN